MFDVDKVLGSTGCPSGRDMAVVGVVGVAGIAGGAGNGAANKLLISQCLG